MLTFFLFGMVAKGQVSETRKATEFSKVEIKNAQLVYMESDSNSFRIEAIDETALAQVKTVISGGTLRITNNGNAYDKVTVYLSANNIASFKAVSNAAITVENQITAKNVTVTLKSGATFTGNIICEDLAKIEGGSHTSFKGKVTAGTFDGRFDSDAKVILGGTAKKAYILTDATVLCNARNFVADAMAISADGSSKVWVYANKTIDIQVFEAAKVIYNGFPKEVSLNQNAIAASKIKTDRYVSYNY